MFPWFLLLQFRIYPDNISFFKEAKETLEKGVKYVQS